MRGGVRGSSARGFERAQAHECLSAAALERLNAATQNSHPAFAKGWYCNRNAILANKINVLPMAYHFSSLTDWATTSNDPGQPRSGSTFSLSFSVQWSITMDRSIDKTQSKKKLDMHFYDFSKFWPRSPWFVIKFRCMLASNVICFGGLFGLPNPLLAHSFSVSFEIERESSWGNHLLQGFEH